MSHLRKHLLLTLFSVLTIYTFGQNVDFEISGQVFLHNSMNKNGKIKYVRDAKITTLKAKSAISDRRGQFKLKFKDVNPDQPIFLNTKKNGYEVVDERDLQYFYIDKKPRLRVFLAESGYIKNARKELIESALKAHNEEKERLLDLLEFGGIAEKAAFKTIQERTGKKLYTSHDAKAYILELSKEYLEHLSFYSYELAIVNPDFASEIYLSALDYYLDSDPEEAVATLQEEKLDSRFKEISKMINEVKGNQEEMSQVIDSRFRRIGQIKNNYVFQIIGLQQFFRFKEADKVIEKLAKVNAIAPTNKCKEQLIEMSAFDAYDSFEPEEVLTYTSPSDVKRKPSLNEKNENKELDKVVLESITSAEEIRKKAALANGIEQEIMEVESYSKPIPLEQPLKENEPVYNSSIAKVDNENKSKLNSSDILIDKGNNENADKMITEVEQVNMNAPSEEIFKKDNSSKSLATASIDDFENILFFSNISSVQLITILQDEQKNILAEKGENNKKDLVSTEIIKRDKLVKKPTPTPTPTPTPVPASASVPTPAPVVIIKPQPQTRVINKTNWVEFSDIPKPSFYSITKKTSLRKSPDPKSKILKRLPIGTEMEFIKRIDKYWYKVRLGGRIGYVKSYRLKKVK